MIKKILIETSLSKMNGGMTYKKNKLPFFTISTTLQDLEYRFSDLKKPKHFERLLLTWRLESHLLCFQLKTSLELPHKTVQPEHFCCGLVDQAAFTIFNGTKQITLHCIGLGTLLGFQAILLDSFSHLGDIWGCFLKLAGQLKQIHGFMLW